MKRWLVIGGGVLVVLVLVVAGVLFFVASNLGDIVKKGVEEFGPRLTQSEVRLDQAEVEARSGRGALRGLFVGNPAGFESPSIFELGEISLDVDITTLTSDTIVIREIVIAAPKVTYEIRPNGDNVSALRENVQRALGGTEGGAGGGNGSSSEEASGAERKFVIENLYLRDGEVSVAASALPGQALGGTLPLPDIHLTDLGKDDGGADPAVVLDKVIEAVTEQVGVAVADVDLEGLLEGVTGEAAEQLRGVLEDTAGEGAGRALQELEGAGDRLKGLLGDGN